MAYVHCTALHVLLLLNGIALLAALRWAAIASLLYVAQFGRVSLSFMASSFIKLHDIVLLQVKPFIPDHLLAALQCPGNADDDSTDEETTLPRSISRSVNL